MSGPGRASRRPGRARGPVRGPDAVSPEVAAEHLRERVYGTVAVLASLVTLVDPGHDGTALSAAVAVAVTVVSLWLASLFADVTSHLATHGTPPPSVLLRSLLSSRSEILATAVTPLLLLGAAGLGWWELGTALAWAAAAQVLTLAVVGLLAVRRARISWPAKVLVVAAEVGLGLLVVGVKLLAH